MKLFVKGKDGGPESTVTGYWLIEWKSVISIALLRFSHGSREAFHDHAFNAISWLISGELREHIKDSHINYYLPSIKPIITLRNTMHRVRSIGTSWALTFRGPWQDSWKEYLPRTGESYTLRSGRVRVD